MGSEALAEAKRRLRAAMRERRARLDPAWRAAASAAITARLLALPEVAAAHTVFLFLSWDTEVDTHPLCAALLASGRRLHAPRMLDRTTMVARPFAAMEELEPGRLGILAPPGTEDVTGPIDVCITPGLAFTQRGERLGFGAGYYDRWFARHAVGARIAPCFEVQVVPEIPMDAFDLPVDAIVTEERVIRVAARAHPGASDPTA